MSTSAIVMMIVAIGIVWGGLAAAIIQLRRHPEQPEPEGSE
ncbi:putative methionine/alanine importer small subunit [Haloactinospora alba]|uniref:Putative methionine/alanine importer small subunit n=1 Tax=Haloactinospora alba TaxID=405555 RepID=A0A543NHQ1_9ACTN|nr:methionine/alanine import family NSS transporter small subunit [Haloactinospora alba]TQN31376.1 putative methionine/alanine importer small subunit [Haloactinospora alba]